MSSEDRPAVRVHVASADVQLGSPAGKRKTARGVYTTFVLTANDPVQCILPEDPARVSAWVVALDNDIVIGGKGQVQVTQNTASGVPVPIGAYIPTGVFGDQRPALFPVDDCNAVYAGITTTSSNSRVSVAAFYED
jgi:hypothetical protein